MKKGIIIGFIAAFVLLGAAVGIPAWWFSSGRDMQTLHDGLSTKFRTSIALVLNLEGYEAKNAAYDSSVTVTGRDDVLKYGGYFEGECALTNYLAWQQRLEGDTKLVNQLMELLRDPEMQHPVNRKLFVKTKANADRTIEQIKLDYSMVSECDQAVRQMASDRTLSKTPRCKVPDR
jgi:hypothetical protein